MKTRKAQIIQTAAKLFKEKGYSAVTMRDLAAHLGIKAASLYNHIQSKQEILNYIIITLAEDFTNQMVLISKSPNTNIQKLSDIIQLHVKISSENPYEMAALNNDWMHLEDQYIYYMQLRKNYENNFRNIIKQGIQNNELINQNPEVILFSMLSTLRSLYLWMPKKEDLNTQQLTQSLVAVLIHGVAN